MKGGAFQTGRAVFYNYPSPNLRDMWCCFVGSFKHFQQIVFKLNPNFKRVVGHIVMTSLQKKDAHLYPQRWGGIRPLLRSQTAVGASCSEHPCCRWGSCDSHRSHQCSPSAKVHQLSCLQHVAPLLSQEWNGSWKEAVRNQKWAEVSGVRPVVWA